MEELSHLLCLNSYSLFTLDNSFLHVFFPLSFVVMSNEEDITMTIFSWNQCTTLSDLINLHFQRTCVLEEAYDTKIYGCVIV